MVSHHSPSTTCWEWLFTDMVVSSATFWVKCKSFSYSFCVIVTVLAVIIWHFVFVWWSLLSIVFRSLPSAFLWSRLLCLCPKTYPHPILWNLASAHLITLCETCPLWLPLALTCHIPDASCGTDPRHWLVSYRKHCSFCLELKMLWVKMCRIISWWLGWWFLFF